MNVKANFLEWFNKRDTYKALTDSQITKYIDGQVDYLEFDPFEVNDDFSNFDEIKSKIISRTSELKTNAEYIVFQGKSNSGAPEAILGKKNYFYFLDEYKNRDKTGLLDLSTILNRPEIQSVIQEPEFYFQKGQDALKKWMSLNVPEELKNTLVSLSKDYKKIQEEAANRDDLKQILDLLFEVISYCDNHAKDKNTINQYDDKRALADAFVRMNSWTEKLIQYKFVPKEVGASSTQNAFDYLLDPIHNTSILSENHRKYISENLIKKPYSSSDFVENLKTYFADYNLQVSNKQNYTHLLMWIVYSFQDRWKDEVIGLMASDGTGWHDKYIEEIKEYDACIIWNSKRPSGTTDTLNFLRDIIENGDSFNLYYCIGGKVYYKATVIDFVENQKELDTKGWISKYRKLYDYKSKFDSYNDEIKSAKIVFLVKTLEKITPISVSEFKFYKDYKVPVQDNLSPIKAVPNIIEIISTPLIEKIMDKKYPPLNQILFGPPGTGKTYNTINKAIEIANPVFDRKQPRTKIKEEFERLMKEGQVVFTTFHQSMNYEDFIEGIKPLKPNQVDTHLKYDVLPGIFKKVCQDAKTPNLVGFDSAFEKLKEELTTTELLSLKTPTGKEFSVSLNSNDNLTLHTGQDREKQGTLTKENIQKQINGEEKFKGWEGYFKGVINYLKIKYKYSENESVAGKNYVLIIDEINRGNVSQIFGELITLIEEDKRLGKDEALEVTLPYSKDKFGVPSNLYIIGTMNTADRSVEAIDTALRRRFSFEEVPPKYDLDELQYEFAGYKGDQILLTLNKRIEKLLDKDHQIGHSYFMKRNGIDVKEMLLTSFYKNIIPLLQEYFFGDFGKIGLVLGQGFVQKKEWNKNSDSFAEFDYESASEFDDRPVYEIIDHRDNVEADDSFVNAIKTLMNKKIG